VLCPKAGFIEHVFLCEAATARLLKDGARLRGPLIRSPGRICDIAGDQTIKSKSRKTKSTDLAGIAASTGTENQSKRRRCF
jgi:hypothetical protein